jgi:adenine phosphoribosyltransferase
MSHLTDPTLAADLARTIRDVRDFPKPGVLFKDITPVLQDAALFRRTTDALAAAFRGAGVTTVVGIESRGFIFGAPVAQSLGVGFVPMRKPGKLPFECVSERYDLEYGSDALEMHTDALGGGAHALLIDDLLATGGTAAAALRLIERCGATVAGVGVVIDLSFLPWRERLSGCTVEALVSF